ncbi:MAG: hypothetical protein HYV17_03290 [Xanthomonadales bacterium]|nr:hypothetical protein [Xanthomonadales bacterium]
MKTKLTFALAALAAVLGTLSVSYPALAATYSVTRCDGGLCTELRCDDFGCVVVRRWREFTIEN